METSKFIFLPSGCVVVLVVLLCSWCVWCLYVCMVLWFVPMCCAIGNSASRCVLGTVHLLHSSEIWLCTKSCLMLLSFINMVPPITGQCRFCATIALNLSLW